MLLIGIDWADDHHDARFMDVDGKSLEMFRFSHDKDGFDLLNQNIQKYNQASNEVLVAIETKHGLLVHYLINCGYTVYGLNPKAVNRYKDRLRSSSKKDDGLDAFTMANILRTDRHLHRPIVLVANDYRLLEKLCYDLDVVIIDSTRQINRLLDSLKEWYPTALGTFGTDSAIFLAFLKEYPSYEAIQSLTEDSFMAFLKKNKYSSPSKAKEIYKHIHRPVPTSDPVAATAGKIKVQSIVNQLVVLHESRKTYERQIKEILDNLPEADIISSLPGVGKQLTPNITAIFGPNMKDAPKRFQEAAEILNYSGINPITIQSGKFKTTHIRHGCNKKMRNIGRHWAACSIFESAWAKAFYDYHNQGVEGRETILRKLAAKWIKIAFHLWNTGEYYDEEKHIAELKKRNVKWAMAL